MSKEEEKKVETVHHPRNNHANFSVFQIIIFAFIFVIMIWIIGFLSLEIDTQKQEISKIQSSLIDRQENSEEIFKFYVDKIRDFQKIDIKDQVQEFGIEIKDNLRQVRELMFDKDDLAEVNTKITILEEYNNTYRGTNLIFLASVVLLRDVINRGENYEVELITLDLVSGRQKEVIEVIKVLEPVATSGVETLTQLKDEFTEKAAELAFISNNPLPLTPSFVDRFMYRMKGLLKVRKIDFQDSSNSPDAIISRVEKYLNENELDKAIKEIKTLEEVAPAGFEYIKDWYTKADIRLKVNQALSTITSLALERSISDINKGTPVKSTSKLIEKFKLKDISNVKDTSATKEIKEEK